MNNPFLEWLSRNFKTISRVILGLFLMIKANQGMDFVWAKWNHDPCNACDSLFHMAYMVVLLLAGAYIIFKSLGDSPNPSG